MRSLCIALIFWASPALAQEPPLVVSSASMIDDIARNIGGDRFQYQTIVPIGGDPHIYEPTPSDARLCGQADLILKNGLTFEGWISQLIQNSGSHAPVVTVTEGVEPIRNTLHANATDPHAWMDATNGIIYARNIYHAMAQLLPADSMFFRKNYEAYKEQLQTLDAEILALIRRIPEKERILITSHDAFHYYGRRYGLRLESILGTSTDADVQTADIRRLNLVITDSGVKAVFIESTINPRMLQQIAHDHGIEIGGSLFADSLSDPEGPAGTYVQMLWHNTQTIVSGLTGMKENGNGAKQVSRVSLVWFLLLAPVFSLVLFFVSEIRRTS